MFKKISISGAGIKGLISLGCLHHYIENDKLDISKITEFSGSSIGSVICLLLLCEYSPAEIFEEMLKIENDKLFKPNKAQGFMEIFGNIGGLFSIDNFISHIERLLSMKGWKQVPTFTELYQRTNKKLIVTAVNITKCQLEYFSHDSTPNMIVTDAIKMSCNLPFVFKKIKYQGCYYVDGGLLNNLPSNILYDNDINTSKILAINVTSLHPISSSDNMGVTEYFFALLNLPIMMNTKLRTQQLQNVETVYLYSKLPHPKLEQSNSYNINFSINEDEKFSLFMLGYLQTCNFYAPVDLYIK
jgi:predicted acylesterase/phospholipase RssA